ncbi:hypothetical protein EMGBS1_03460 [Chloroflexota bacterium]|nr:hypothetical protein EMGBS1_03460 [Chloroflexota bacterium]
MPCQVLGNDTQILGSPFNPRAIASHTEIDYDGWERSYSGGSESDLN